MLKQLIYNKDINSFLRNLLKPFAPIIPEKIKFPVNGTFTVKGNGVTPFKIMTNPTSCVTKYLFWGNIEGFEFNSVKVFCELAKTSKVFFDIGANIGYYSLLASSIKKKDIVIYAFEPMPSAYDFLIKNIEINGFNNIKPQKLALSKEKGTATFYSIANEKFKNMPQLTGDGSLNKAHSNSTSKSLFDVNINTLDGFVDDYLGNLKIDLIKLDTEANEHFVLSGSHNVLSNHRPIIQCEILKNQIEIELENILMNYNYLYFRATDKGLIPVDSFQNNTTNFVDYYLVPEEKKHVVNQFLA
ncbi:MAG: FkbM family methyltransferase [Bacteroidetes bacterium]|nr:FkbM family methyltransferase [Bacteroidota bacterium]